MNLGIAADHGGYYLKEWMNSALTHAGHTIIDFGANSLDQQDDFPTYVIPLARAVAAGDIERGIAICGSGVGASIAANKVAGVRAALITDIYSAHQGVEDDHMNIICLGGRVVGQDLAWDLIQAFLASHYNPAERFERRLAEVAALERQG